MAESQALFQNSFYIGNNFNAILYGVELMLYFMTVQTMLDPKHKKSKSDKFFFAYSTMLLCCNTIFVATEAVFGEEMWIVNADYPGGQDAYLGAFVNVWYQTLGTCATVLQNYLSDALLLYRCYIIWNDWRVIAFPFLLYLGTIGTGVAGTFESARPGSNYFIGLSQKLGTSYTTCLVSLNLLLTLLITTRILYAARQCTSATDRAAARTYTNAAAIVVESALPYTAFGLAYLATFARESQTSILFLSLHVMFCCISPQMIVLRVISGRGWTKEQTVMLSSAIVFDTRGSEGLDTTRVHDDEESATTEKPRSTTRPGSPAFAASATTFTVGE